MQWNTRAADTGTHERHAGRQGRQEREAGKQAAGGNVGSDSVITKHEHISLPTQPDLIQT